MFKSRFNIRRRGQPAPSLWTKQIGREKGMFFHKKLIAVYVFSFIRCMWVMMSCCVMKQESKVLKFLGFMWNPLSWVMEAAAIMAIALANGGGRPPDWQDFVGIIALLVINSTISFIEENNAGNAAAALMAGLAPKTKVFILPLNFLS